MIGGGKRLKRIRTNQNGYAMLLVMLVMLVLFLLGTAILAVAGNSKKDSLSQKNQLQAYYIAEAGVEKTLARAINDQDWLDGYDASAKKYLSNTSYADGTIAYVNVKKESIAGGYKLTIESKGQFSGSSRTLTVVADVPSNSLDFSKGLWVKTDTELKDFKLNSDVLTNSEVNLNKIAIEAWYEGFEHEGPNSTSKGVF